MEQIDYQTRIPLDKSYQVIVIGAGPSGCAAAAAAARHGAKTLLLEQSGMAGGMGTLGLVPFWCPFTNGKEMIYRGIAEEVYEKSRPSPCCYPETRKDWVPIEAEKLKRTYDALLRGAGVDVNFFSTAVSVIKNAGNRIDAVVVGSRAGLKAFTADIFIDTTGDGDAAAWAGVPFEIGGAGGRVQEATMCFTAVNVDSYHYNFSPWRHLRSAGPWHDPAKSPFRHPSVWQHCLTKQHGPGMVGFNAGHFAGLRSDDIPTLSRAMMDGRILAADTIEDLKKAAPEVFASARLGATPGMMGLREGRRFRTDHVLTWEDYRDRRSFEDDIARNCYFIDLHGETDPQLKNMVREIACKNGESHGIPYRSLLPEGIENLLLAGRCIGSDHLVYGSVRVMPVCLVTGQAAGTAAALAVRQDGTTRGVDTAELRKVLREDGAFLG